ncbi:MAG: Na+/H+ antiporter NhaC family protein [Oscillibacter sp.]|uniref:Na+/H+ antiporter NhaC family protein n=1 Tax=Oscillibacter sp. TaxID=1945593 RepID=UPI00217454D4|nr:Na+/H+ antiporter NhaC family protein [Oscillibacter sp.]MCI9114185.1 Na+/H+ antiporter NhaC family protein [Oscillibacter sp.]MCI9299607.1 Na+/H+ antiporter NhaC family protein [Oscillibacter sp.]
MRTLRRRFLPLLAVVMLLCAAMTVPALAAGEDPTELAGTKYIECPDCGTSGVVLSGEGEAVPCETCADSGYVGYVESPSPFYNTFWSLIPPIIAIALALITKEVYSSLFLGILVGGLLYSSFAFEATILHVFNDGIVASVTDSYNMGILIFLIILGSMVCLMNKAGGSAAFGRWAKDHIKSRVGAQLASVLLGVLIFIDDYFNCLTVGSVMRPITDKHNISRAKLAYIIDATAAPVCIIAPISSWAAAVAGFAEDGQGFNLFLRAIPYNYYALLTIVMMVGMILMKAEFGPMAKYEKNAIEKGDLFSGSNPYAGAEDDAPEDKGRVLDLVLPVVVLIICCVIGMIYSGGFFDGEGFITAFSNSDASVGLMLGSAFALVFTLVYYLIRRSMSFKEMMGCIPEGFKAMVPAIMILTFAWSLKNMTDSLGAKFFVRDFVRSSASGLQMILPLIVFAIGCLLAFATGTSWGTFGILIPIVQNVFSMDNPMAIVCISACMAGAVCGDHCSPISDTTIMASAGAQCDHVNHVSTQLPYAITCAVVSGVTYLIAGILVSMGAPGLLGLPIGIVLMIGALFVIRSKNPGAN